jgi:chromosome partitioning protein
MKKPIVITVTNHKGGVGKTTVSCNLACSIARRKKSNGEHYKGLLLDMDPQGNSSSTIITEKAHVIDTISEVLEYGRPMKDCWYPTKQKNLKVIPSNIHLFRQELKMMQAVSPSKYIQKLFDKEADFLSEFDYMVIDSPPNLGPFMMNSIMACDYYIVPIEAGSIYSLEGLHMLEEIISEIKEVSAKKIDLLGYVLNKFDGRTVAGREMKHQVKHFYGDKMLTTIIRRNTAIEKAQCVKKTVWQVEPNSYGAMDFEALASEVVEKVKLDA